MTPLMKITSVAGHPFCRECITRSRCSSHRCALCRREQPTLEDNGHEAAASHNPAQHIRTAQPAEQSSELRAILRLMRDRQEAGSGSDFGLQDLSGLGILATAEEHSRIPESYIDTTIMTGVGDLQSEVQSLLARIISVEDRPLVWDLQQLELRRANQQLADARSIAAPNLLQVMSDIQEYTASVTADFAEFMRHSERQQQTLQEQNRQQQVQQQQSQQRLHSSQASLDPLIDVLQLFRQLLT